MDEGCCSYQIKPVLRTLRRIALLSVHTSPSVTIGGRKAGGMNVMVRAIANTLGKRGLKVDIFTRIDTPEHEGRIEILSPNVRLIYLPAGPAQHLEPDAVYRYVSQFVNAMLAFAENEKVDYDIIYSHYWISGAVALKLREVWHIPVVQMFHTLGQMKDRIAHAGDVDHPPQTLIPPTPSQRITVETAIMNEADRLIAATHAERVQMLMLYRADRRRIDIVPPGVDVHRFYPIDRDEAKAKLGLDPQKRLLLFVGRIEPLKGIDLLCEALALIKRAKPDIMTDVVMHIVGGNPADDTPDNAELHRLEALCCDLCISDVIKFVPAKSQEALLYAYNAAEALIMPSDYESFGMVALEAMACGTPVIASEVGGLAFLVRDGVTGYHVPTRDPKALAERIYTLLNHPDRRDLMGQAAHEAAKAYSWTRIADQLVEIFNLEIWREESHNPAV